MMSDKMSLLNKQQKGTEEARKQKTRRLANRQPKTRNREKHMTASSAKNALNNTANASAGNESTAQDAAFATALTAQTGEETLATFPIPRGAGFSIMGDSISTLGGFIPPRWRCHYEGEVSIPGVDCEGATWWGQVIQHFGGHLVANSSFSGSTVEGFGFPAGCSAARAEGLIGIEGEKPQVVLVFMGINDYGWGSARNQVMGNSASRSANPQDLGGQEPVLLTVDSAAIQRFKSAYATMLDNIRAVAPNAQIWCLTLAPAFTGSAEDGNTITDTADAANTTGVTDKAASCSATLQVPASSPLFIYRVRGIDLDEYNEAIRACAQNAGAHVADVRAFDVDYESVDNTHPSALGMKQIASMVCAQMEGMPANVAACAATYPMLACAPASRRHCDKTTCEGCRFSPVTPTSWILTCGKEHTSIDQQEREPISKIDESRVTISLPPDWDYKEEIAEGKRADYEALD